MSKVVITMEDGDDGSVNVVIDFGGMRSDSDSLAHCLAMDMLSQYDLLSVETETVQ